LFIPPDDKENSIRAPGSEEDVNKCHVCRKVILEGLNEALRVEKVQVIQKPPKAQKSNFEKKQKAAAVVQEMQEKSLPLSFGVSGTGLTATPGGLFNLGSNSFKLRST